MTWMPERYLNENELRSCIEPRVFASRRWPRYLPPLDYYGSSLGIAGRSNNLAHKLMLEGRLVVREI